MSPQEELLRLRELLRIEKEYDLRQYEVSLKEQTLTERRAKGTCWYPMIIKETGYGLGEYPYIIAERTGFKEVPHRFQGGRMVALFSNQEYYKGEEVRGTVNYVDGDRIKMVLFADELPEWVEDGKIGINLLFDEWSYKAMEAALEKVIKVEHGRLKHLVDVLFGLKEPQFDRLRQPLETRGLNDAQISAVEKIVSAEDVALVHGPPGTGKTTTLVEAVRLIAQDEKNILVCAPSNAAADLLTERLATAGLNVVRIGNLSRIDDAVMGHTLEVLMGGHADMKEIRRMRKQADEYRRMAGKYKRHFGKEEREQRDALYKEAKQVVHIAAKLEEQMATDILDRADAITCTLVGSLNQYLEKRKFRTAIIDEAAQALEPMAWIPITLCERIILAGDPFQLPPTVRSKEAQEKGLNQTLLEKTMNRLPIANLLEVQYRMNSTIMGFSNEWFYDGQLKADVSVATATLPAHPGLAGHAGPDSYRDVEALRAALEFIDTAGCGFEEQEEAVSKSLFNIGETDVLAKRLQLLHDAMAASETHYSVGIISPYREQVIWLQEHIEVSAYPLFDISIDTIDSFQGQERDIVFISLVRCNDRGEIGFLSDFRRMNVAITRARKKLVVIGDSGTLSGTKFYQAFIHYAEKHGTYLSAWEFM